MLTIENTDNTRKPTIKFPEVASSSDPNPMGPMAIPKLEDVVSNANPKLVCSGFINSGNKENTTTGTKAKPPPKAIAQNVKGNHDVTIPKKAMVIMERPRNNNLFFCPVLSMMMPIIGVMKTGINIIILVRILDL